MAWPGSLTTEQQTAVQDFTTSCRTWAALLAQMNILGAAIGAANAGGISTLLSDLQTTDVIPNTSGLAGSQDLLASDVISLASWAWAAANPQNTTSAGGGAYATVGIQQTCVKAAGINASIGKESARDF